MFSYMSGFEFMQTINFHYGNDLMLSTQSDDFSITKGHVIEERLDH